ncbi:CDP-alcohol phosphatidyltransferase family protein [Phenylobacterium sp. Root700]|uniref:CDP-alcohol phosphatidyltransferase family protein n=1 Tax=Phenylobacterium sp. Root700 TaxID=1736591 RepID=UPI0006F2D8F7|nr:CDP-alcohol phosphatidyltransferase family protein [Phenylobacterium sp. Root700]KRB40593.1 CDP-alcohol phosphatidyltransferase [Phenylobacterium sp. Root700]
MTARAQTIWRRVLAEDGGVKLANLVTLSRGAAIAPIFLLLVLGHGLAALGLYVLAAATDLVDGWLARRSGRASAFGAQLDAVVDNLFSVAILGFLLLAFPELGERHGLALTILFGGPLAYLALSWLARRQFMMFHFWSAKAGAVLLFCLWPLVAITGWEGWIALAAAVVGLSRLEQLVFIFRGGRDLDAPHGLASASRRDIR